MTLEQILKVLEKVLGPYKLNITNYENKKIKKIKEVFKSDNNIYCIKNENMRSLIKYIKVNFLNRNNSCFIYSFSHSFNIHLQKR